MRFGIATKLAILLTAFALLISGITALHVYHASRELLKNAAQERLLTTTQVLGRRIVNVMNAAVQDARRLADSPDAIAVLQAPDSSATKTKIDELVAQFTSQLRFNPEYYQIRLISASDHGLERVRVDRENDHQFIRIEGDDLQEKGVYPYVFEALKLHRGGVYSSPMLINHELGAHAGTEMPSLRISVPIFVEHDDNPAGLIVINLSMNGIFSLLGEDLPKDHELYIANHQGEFIVHPDPSMAFAFDRGRSARVQEQFPETADLYDGISKNFVFAKESSLDGHVRPVAAAFIRVNGGDIEKSHFFVLGLAQSLDVVLASSHTLTTSTIPVILGFGCLAVVLAIWLARAFTRPLRHIANEVRHFSEHSEVSTRLPVERTDEVGILARGLAAMQLDIKEKLDELDRQRAELHYQAHHDSLTELPNRLMLKERFEQMLFQSLRTGSIVAVFFVDLDKFKMINDLYGHEAGDTVLKETAKRLRSMVRKEDTIVRMGGDEFIILMEDFSDKNYLKNISNKLTEVVSRPIQWGSETLYICASIGIACAPIDGDNIDKLASCADARMYAAKAAGGAKVIHTSEADL